MSKTKTVFTETEIAHVWAHKGAASGRTGLSAFMHGGYGARQRFEGDAFYSYNTVIARRISHKGKTAYVIDRASFGPTTAKHLRMVRDAIPDGVVFSVSEGKRGQSLTFTPASLRDYYLTEYRKPADHSPYAHIRAKHMLARDMDLQHAIHVCVHFGLPYKALTKEQAKIASSVSAAREIVEATDALQKKRREERQANQSAIQRQKDLARQRAAISEAEQIIQSGSFLSLPENEGYSSPFGWEDSLLESRPDLKAGIADLRIKRDASKIQDWLAGKPGSAASHQWPTLLRMEGEEMVTSKGARVPLSDTKRAFEFLSRMRRNEHLLTGLRLPFKVGMYQIDAVNAHGVVAGCHRLSWSEVERFARQMGWIN